MSEIRDWWPGSRINRLSPAGLAASILITEIFQAAVAHERFRAYYPGPVVDCLHSPTGRERVNTNLTIGAPGAESKGIPMKLRSAQLSRGGAHTGCVADCPRPI